MRKSILILVLVGAFFAGTFLTPQYAAADHAADFAILQNAFGVLLNAVISGFNAVASGFTDLQTDVDSNTAAISGIGPHTVDTNAGTICGTGELLDGDGACIPIPGGENVFLKASLEGDQEVPPFVTSASGTATFELNPDIPSLSYFITLQGIDLDGAQTGSTLDDVTGMHFHLAPRGINGAISFGMIAPGHDSDDLVIDAVAGTVSGVWVDTDPANISLTDSLNDLLNRQLYVNVHTIGMGSGEIRGQIYVDCGVDMTYSNNWCFENTVRPVTDWLTAAQVCNDLGLQLPPIDAMVLYRTLDDTGAGVNEFWGTNFVWTSSIDRRDTIDASSNPTLVRDNPIPTATWNPHSTNAAFICGNPFLLD